MRLGADWNSTMDQKDFPYYCKLVTVNFIGLISSRLSQDESDIWIQTAFTSNKTIAGYKCGHKRAFSELASKPHSWDLPRIYGISYTVYLVSFRLNDHFSCFTLNFRYAIILKTESANFEVHWFCEQLIGCHGLFHISGLFYMYKMWNRNWNFIKMNRFLCSYEN